MKNQVILFLLLTLVFAACEEADKDIRWGYSKLYMPQAVAANGGLDNNFTVKINPDTPADTSVVVGLYRSGLEELKSVSVDLEVYPDTLAAAIAQANVPFPKAVYEIYKTARLLPSEYYELPSKITLKDGMRETSVRLVIKKQKLIDDPFFMPGNRFVLPVRIANPTRYELNPALSLTMFIFEIK